METFAPAGVAPALRMLVTACGCRQLKAAAVVKGVELMSVGPVPALPLYMGTKKAGQQRESPYLVDCGRYTQVSSLITTCIKPEGGGASANHVLQCQQLCNKP